FLHVEEAYLPVPVLSSLCPRTTPPKRLYHSDLVDKSVKFWTVPTIARRAVLGRDAKNGTIGAFGSQSADAGQSGCAWPVSPSARPVPLRVR
ncbi:MAG: hypothetical protein PHV27_11705, partial [Mesotoga sp.]|uniref:hypothetical protein n=1 Tax=Mesotoga sp. TaxID=2053577 RepID=UPI0026023487